MGLGVDLGWVFDGFGLAFDGFGWVWEWVSSIGVGSGFWVGWGGYSTSNMSGVRGSVDPFSKRSASRCVKDGGSSSWGVSWARISIWVAPKGRGG